MRGNGRLGYAAVTVVEAFGLGQKAGMTQGVHPILEATEVNIARGDALVIEGLSLSLKRGEALHVTGANGAGKSTLLLALCGLIPLAGGTVSRDPQQLAFLGHDNGLLPDLSVAENLRLYAQSGAVAAPPVLAALGVEALLDKPAKTLSFGQARRVALALTCLPDRTLWLLDEPFAGLDSATSGALEALLIEQISSGAISVVFSSHERSLPGAKTLRLGSDAAAETGDV